MRKQSRRQRTFLGLILCRAATFGSGSADVPEQETGGPDCRRGEGRDLDILEIFFFRSAKWLNPDPPPHTHTREMQVQDHWAWVAGCGAARLLPRAEASARKRPGKCAVLGPAWRRLLSGPKNPGDSLQCSTPCARQTADKTRKGVRALSPSCFATCHLQACTGPWGSQIPNNC